MQGLLLQGLITPADVQDRDGGIALLSTLFGMFPFLKKLFADSAYQGRRFTPRSHRSYRILETEIVKRSDAAKGFVALPKRWIVERSIGWLNRCRRLAKDWENRSLSAFIFPSASPQSASYSESSVINHEDMGRNSSSSKKD